MVSVIGDYRFTTRPTVEAVKTRLDFSALITFIFSLSLIVRLLGAVVHGENKSNIWDILRVS